MKFSFFFKVALVTSLLIVGYLVYLFSPPRSFPIGTVFRVTQNESAVSVGHRLYESHIISSPKIFRSLLIFFAYDKTIQPGPYTFEKKENIFSVAKRLGSGIFKTNFVKVTLPEGITTKEMAYIISKKISNFDIEKFNLLSKDSEGYLFPDTYYFDPIATPEMIIEQLRSTFNLRTAEILADNKDIKSTIILASILEKEGQGETQQKMIAGILTNRLRSNLLLQVDAPFMFLLGKESKDLTAKDLKINSPYNTYLYKGLPPGPIGNPGVVAIKAALEPTQSSYLFYLHDKNGGIHYAKTYAEHLKNKAQYLK